VPATHDDAIVVDCDVHTGFQQGFADVVPYLDPQWRHYVELGKFSGPGRGSYTPWQGAHRMDSYTDDGRVGSSVFEHLRDHHLDAWGIDIAISTGDVTALSVCYMPQREFANAVASAFNDHLIETWLGRDSRILGSIVVAAQDVAASVAEIHRVGGHPSVCQVVLPTRSPLTGQWGDERYHPIWEAAVEQGLAIGFHTTAAGGNTVPPLPTGWPRTYMELTSAYAIPAQAELLGLVLRGVFEKFPALRVAMIETGFAWLPSLMWRMDKRWRELRSEVPWLTRLPSEYILDQVRLTTQPMEEPPKRGELAQVIEMMGSEKLLMFATDYPHWDFDSPTRALPSELGAHVKRRILGDNAVEFYRLDQQIEQARAEQATRAPAATAGRSSRSNVQ
jgi:predicted TIM-barrel fold metal-dependent hydrolase